MKKERLDVEIKPLTPKEGYSFYHKDDVELEIPSKEVFLGKEDTPDNWVEREDMAE